MRGKKSHMDGRIGVCVHAQGVCMLPSKHMSVDLSICHMGSNRKCI